MSAYLEKCISDRTGTEFQVCDASRKIQTVCNNKSVKSLDVAQGKLYIGCADSSIQVGEIIGIIYEHLHCLESIMWSISFRR